MNHRIRRSVAAMQGYVPGEQPAAPDIVKLNTNENPYPPSPAVAEALASFACTGLRLYPNPRAAALRGEIASLHGCAPEQVLVGNGSDELLALCVRAFVERDAAVGYFDPSYSLYPVLAAIEEIAVEVTPLGTEFEWAPPRTSRSSLFFLTHPNAPTGILYPEREVRRFTEAFPGIVVLDEAYADFAPRDGMALALASDNVLAVRTLSKAYSLAGLRLGYLVGHRSLIEALDRIKDSYNVGGLPQALALAALRDRDTLRENVRRIVRTRERVARALADRGFRVFPSAANFLWVGPPRAPAEAWFRALRGRRILVRHFPGERTGAFLRVTIGDEAQMDRFLEAVDALAAGGLAEV